MPATEHLYNSLILAHENALITKALINWWLPQVHEYKSFSFRIVELCEETHAILGSAASCVLQCKEENQRHIFVV